jgi:hypothetical protein
VSTETLKLKLYPLGYTNDPLGDLAAGRYDTLVSAALHDAGIRR